MNRVSGLFKQHNLLVISGLGLVVAIVLTACGSSSTKPTPPRFEATFASIQAELFTNTCATSSCHDAVQREAGLCLEAGFSYEELVGVDPTTERALEAGKKRVDPGNPANSFLVDKLKGLDPYAGHRMPYNGPYLPDNEIEVVEKWIADGAQP